VSVLPLEEGFFDWWSELEVIDKHVRLFAGVYGFTTLEGETACPYPGNPLCIGNVMKLVLRV